MCVFQHHAHYKFVCFWAAVTISSLSYLCSGEASERNSAVWGGGQQHLLGVPASLSPGHRQVALPEGRKEETGKEEQFVNVKRRDWYFREYNCLLSNLIFFCRKWDENINTTPGQNLNILFYIYIYILILHILTYYLWIKQMRHNMLIGEFYRYW